MFDNMLIEIFFYFLSFSWFGFNWLTPFIFGGYISNVLILIGEPYHLIGYSNPFGRFIHIILLIFVPGGLLMLMLLKVFIDYIIKGK